MPLLPLLAGMPLLGAIAGRHCWAAMVGMPLLGAALAAIGCVGLLGAIAGCHWMPC